MSSVPGNEPPEGSTSQVYSFFFFLYEYARYMHMYKSPHLVRAMVDLLSSHYQAQKENL